MTLTIGNQIDVIELRDWLLIQLGDLQINSHIYRSVLFSLHQQNNHVVYCPQSALDYRKNHIHESKSVAPSQAQISIANHYLIAAACFAWGNTDKRWLIPAKAHAKYGWEVRREQYNNKWIQEFQEIARKNNSPESFFQAWVSQPKVGRKIGAKQLLRETVADKYKQQLETSFTVLPSNLWVQFSLRGFPPEAFCGAA